MHDSKNSSIKPRRKRGWLNLIVNKIKVETHDTKTLYMTDKDDDGGCPFDYIAGQYLTFRFDQLSEKPIVRSYTMSSSPCQRDFYAVTVKEVDDGFVSTHLCKDLKEGDILRARGPIGKFVYDPKKDHKKLALVAGGSGVTPFVSIIREYLPQIGTEGGIDSIHLLLSYRTQKDLICWEELSKWNEHPKVNISVTLTREEADGFLHGRIDRQKISDWAAKELGDSLDKTTFMTCGPTGIMNQLTGFLEERKVDPECIKTEAFD